MNNPITKLRDLVPLRPLTTVEALAVAERQANRLLRLCHVKTPPLSDAVLTALPRIQVEHVSLGAVAAAARWVGGRWLVLVNTRDCRGRQRFSLAHEIKHILDHPFAAVIYPRRRGAGAIETSEQACDYFAACLLMPRRWIRSAWRSGIRDVPTLARRFGVTRHAVRVRLLQVGLIEATHPHLITEA